MIQINQAESKYPSGVVKLPISKQLITQYLYKGLSMGNILITRYSLGLGKLAIRKNSITLSAIGQLISMNEYQ